MVPTFWQHCVARMERRRPCAAVQRTKSAACRLGDEKGEMSPRTTSDDPRARRTREDLREALVSLVSEKGFEAVRVRDLAGRARVNRATFYKHYRDKWDLLEDIFEGAIADLEARMGPPPKDTGVVDLDDPPDAWIELFEYLAERAGFYRAVLGEGGSPWFAARVRERIGEVVGPRLREMERGAARAGMPREVVLAFVSHAMLGTISWWLEDGRRYPAERMAGWTMRLVATGAYAASGLRPPP